MVAFALLFIFLLLSALHLFLDWILVLGSFLRCAIFEQLSHFLITPFHAVKFDQNLVDEKWHKMTAKWIVAPPPQDSSVRQVVQGVTFEMSQVNLSSLSGKLLSIIPCLLNGYSSLLDVASFGLIIPANALRFQPLCLHKHRLFELLEFSLVLFDIDLFVLKHQLITRCFQSLSNQDLQDRFNFLLVIVHISIFIMELKSDFYAFLVRDEHWLGL